MIQTDVFVLFSSTTQLKMPSARSLGLKMTCTCITLLAVLAIVGLRYKTTIATGLFDARSRTVLLFQKNEKDVGNISAAIKAPQGEQAASREQHQYTVILSTPCLVVLAGKQSHKRYAVFSANWDGDTYTYSFMLPLTTLAWRRIGYGSVVLIVGNLKQWRNTPARNHILEGTLEQGAVVVFLQGAPAVNSVMLSQISRIFAAAFVPFNDSSDTVLVTSDADIWPVNDTIYNLPSGRMSIKSINAFCCGFFLHNGTDYRELPMSNIIANVATWRKMIRPRTKQLSCPSDIVNYAEFEFGAVARKTVVKGGNAGWTMDQHLVSMWVADWERHHGNHSVGYVRRNSYHDRIDRARWAPRTLHNIVDSHLLLGAHREEVWRRVRPLLKLLYGSTSAEYRWCEQYQKQFIKFI